MDVSMDGLVTSSIFMRALICDPNWLSWAAPLGTCAGGRGGRVGLRQGLAASTGRVHLA